MSTVVLLGGCWVERNKGKPVEELKIKKIIAETDELGESDNSDDGDDTCEDDDAGGDADDDQSLPDGQCWDPGPAGI